ncbi:MAG: septum formation initiator family protein [Ruminococcus sp.]|nr:septum formation initiator family protein [Ruminococcus sp.]MBR2304905.1 septum formation initiator family protein [Ruminococcus sp.]
MLWFGKKDGSEDTEYAADTEAAIEKPKKSRLVRLLLVLAVLLLLGYSVFTIVSQQAQVAQLRKESADIQKKITAAKQQNDEYVRLLKAENEEEYMERLAIENLGYAYPNEKRYYIVTDGK